MKSLLTVCLVLLFSACSTAAGAAIVTGQQRQPIDPEAVQLYLEKPPNYEIIGLVRASSGAGRNDQESSDFAIAELKAQAARLGANGIYLQPSDFNTINTVNNYFNQYGAFISSTSIRSQQITGIAILVPQSDSDNGSAKLSPADKGPQNN